MTTQQIPEALRGLPVPVMPRRPIPAPSTPPRTIFGWLADQAGCAYYRVTLPLLNLPNNRWTGGASSTYEETLEFADTVVGQRICLPGPTKKWQRLCKDPNTLTVFELDDDFWAIDATNGAHDFYSDPQARANLERNIAAADRVTVTTEPLAERVRQWNPNVVVVPNYIDGAVLTNATPEQAVDTVTVGWPGSNTHTMDWAVAGTHIIDAVLGEPRARMAFLGAKYPQGVPRDRVNWIPWQTSVPRYLEHLGMAMDIGVAPLKEHPFNVSKSAIRVLELAGCGIPVVASNVRPYAEFVQHGVTGFLVKDPEDWGRYLRDLINDRSMRIEMGEAARKLAAQHTIQGHIGEHERAWTR
jgi:hypothetical protein